MTQGSPGLTYVEVHRIRTAGLTDAHFANLFGATEEVIRNARTGVTFKHHLTPPDLRPRPRRRATGVAAVEETGRTEINLARRHARSASGSTPEHS